ncbi:MAG: LemA family protein [Sphingomonadaceae bacterium]|jgi:LemA protein|nr:LemA family protein [Paracoccaceae bacterium]MCB2083268.1 LemA family protein [Sphingomonadaceae bacterium]
MDFRMFRRFALVAMASIGLAACGINSVPTAEENAKAKWGDVEAAFQSRANLLPNIEALVKGARQGEEDIFVGVAEARAKAGSVQITDADLSDPAKMEAYAEAQNALGSGLSRLFATVESNPNPQFTRNIETAQDQVEGAENRIRIAIKDYNEAVRQYNTTIRTFPDSIGANIIHGAEPMVPYKAASEGAEVAERIDIS